MEGDDNDKEHNKKIKWYITKLSNDTCANHQLANISNYSHIVNTMKYDHRLCKRMVETL